MLKLWNPTINTFYFTAGEMTIVIELINQLQLNVFGYSPSVMSFLLDNMRTIFEARLHRRKLSVIE